MTKKKWFWSLLFVVIAGLSIWAVSAQSKSFSLKELLSSIQSSGKGWLFGGILCMFGFIWLEGRALKCVSNAFGYPTTNRQGFVYSSADIYFSAITPSATGGQPASAYFMIKDKIPGAVTTVILLINLIMYTLAILTVGLLGLILRPGIMLHFSLVSKLLILVGYIILLFLAWLFLMLLKQPRLLYQICSFFLQLGKKLHMVKNINEKKKKLVKTMKEYSACAKMISGQRKMLILAFVYNLLQRISQITVTVMVFMAMGNSPEQILDIWVTQAFVAIGTYSVPIPGGMGIADFLLLDGLRGSFGLHESRIATLELMSRSLSFYCCIIICALAVLLGYVNVKRRKRKNDRNI